MSDEYSKYSPYYTTKKFGTFLDVLDFRSVPKSSTDVAFKINNVYQYRPDLLAHDLYGRASLWWVFSARNPNVIQDPIYDFKAGKTIFIPNGDTLKNSLGV
jgi:Base plate wedge protein 53